MEDQFLVSFGAGMTASLAVASPAEWAVHKYMLHPPKEKRRWYNKGSARSHNDIHHMGYLGPEHYYRDSTNEHVTIHFSPKYVALIAAIAAGVGASINGAVHLIKQNPEYGKGDAAFIAGFFTGVMAYYSAYEFSHHYMHVIGKRRLTINRVLGDTLQEEPDGNLRLPKPLLDDICHAVENHADENVGKPPYPGSFYFDKSLVDRLNDTVEINRRGDALQETPSIDVQPNTGQDTLDSVTTAMLTQEEEHRASLSRPKRFLYDVERKVIRGLRSWPAFQSLDNHHFVHHYRFNKNLNVVLPLMDQIMGTKLRSTRKKLEENIRWWLCPNSPDEEPFPIPS